MRRLVYVAILRPLILLDYKLREWGWKPDEWYWADRLAISWGYFTGGGE